MCCQFVTPHINKMMQIRTFCVTVGFGLPYPTLAYTFKIKVLKLLGLVQAPKVPDQISALKLIGFFQAQKLLGQGKALPLFCEVQEKITTSFKPSPQVGYVQENITFSLRTTSFRKGFTTDWFSQDSNPDLLSKSHKD